MIDPQKLEAAATANGWDLATIISLLQKAEKTFPFLENILSLWLTHPAPPSVTPPAA